MRARNGPTLLYASILSACGGPPSPRASGALDVEASPLGRSYVLIPLPSASESLLGRILHQRPEPGQSLEEVARPNPCEQYLAARSESPLANTFEDAEELAVGARARAVLGTFGFQGDFRRATHFLYKLETSRRIERTDTNEYVQCCQGGQCGYGFVSALVYGNGEYATGEEAAASGGVNVSVASTDGTLSLRVLHKRRVHGYVAALVAVTDGNRASEIGALGVEDATGVTFETLPNRTKKLYEMDKLRIQGQGEDYWFVDGRGEHVSENEFVRRFRSITGSDELDDYERHRNLTFGILAAVGGAGGLAWSIYGWTSLFSEDGSGLAMSGVFLGTLAAVFGLGGGTILLLSPDDGGPDIADHDAELYVDRYNRALLRKRAREVQDSLEPEQARLGPRLTLRPTIAPPFLGLTGTF